MTNSFIWLAIIVLSFFGMAACIFPTGGGTLANPEPMREFSSLEFYGTTFFLSLFLVSVLLYIHSPERR